jgi:hypothetical protein
MENAKVYELNRDRISASQPAVDAIQGSMFNFQQSLPGSIVPNVPAVPIDQAVPQKFNTVFNLKLA